MSDEEKANNNSQSTQNESAEQESHTDITLSYHNVSEYSADEQHGRLTLFGDIHRDPVSLSGYFKNPLKVREALLSLYDIVGSDYSYIPKDRSAYQAFRRMRSESATQGAWQAQQAYFEWLRRNDPLAFLILDPVISVHPDNVFLEVFSKDEGTYAKLDINRNEIDLISDVRCGTTNIDFSEMLKNGIEQFRSHRKTMININHDSVKVAVGNQGEVLEKKIKLPDSWFRGFLQVQSAAMLSQDYFSLSAMDLYNLLRQLRLHKDKKGERRGVRVELVPGEKPRLVLEPWETLIESSGEVYRGLEPKIIRLWGRRRLLLLKRMLPFIERVDIHVIGSGLPAFWVLRCGAITLTLGLTGFVASDWSQAASFDLLLSRSLNENPHENLNVKKVISHLSNCWFDSFDGILQATELDTVILQETLQLACQLGKIIFDIANDVYRLRSLSQDLPSWERLQFRNQTDRFAHDLIARGNAVSIVSENQIAGKGSEITGKVAVKEDEREYRPQLLLNEGMLKRASCTCKKQSANNGQPLATEPCVHLVALRLAWSQFEYNRRKNNELRQQITIETRLFSRRNGKCEQVTQISLDNRHVNVRWGFSGSELRAQRLTFNTVEQARHEYFQQMTQLKADGYLDASAG